MPAPLWPATVYEQILVLHNLPIKSDSSVLFGEGYTGSHCSLTLANL